MAGISAPHRACFELGVKFGSLYHQFIGTPISPRSVGSLEAAIAESIANQPFCSAIEVTIDRDQVAADIDDRYEYTELAGTMLSCRIEVTVEGATAIATIETVDGYPEMRIVEVGGEDGTTSG